MIVKSSLLAMFTCAFLLSCNPQKSAHSQYDYNLQAEIYEFKTPSGRECVFVDKGNSGGLSCRW